MARFFTRERFGQPQALAGMLLLVFLAQCAWLVNRSAPGGEEISRIREGLGQWHGEWIAGTPLAVRSHVWERDHSFDTRHSALWYLIASAPLWVSPVNPGLAHWLADAPYLVFGVLLGASLWYVARRLYGNAGGYVALMLYCFSPGIVRSSAAGFSQPDIGAAWGAFGATFTAIAVAHTLYAPREVVLWNWRRILLLGVSLALAVGSQFSLIVVLLPVTLAFMLHIAPERRSAAAVIWAAAVGISTLLLFASYFFHGRAFWLALRHASFFEISWHAFVLLRAYTNVGAQVGQSSPALILALPAAVITWVLWPRARYFGNTAPLLVSVLLLLLAVGAPHHSGLCLPLVAMSFLFVFVSGIAADMLESRPRNLVTACVWGLLVVNAGWTIWELARARS